MQTAAEIIRETCADVIAAKFPPEPLPPGVLSVDKGEPAYLDQPTGVGLSEFILHQGAKSL